MATHERSRSLRLESDLRKNDLTTCHPKSEMNGTKRVQVKELDSTVTPNISTKRGRTRGVIRPVVVDTEVDVPRSPRDASPPRSPRALDTVQDILLEEMLNEAPAVVSQRSPRVEAPAVVSQRSPRVEVAQVVSQRSPRVEVAPVMSQRSPRVAQVEVSGKASDASNYRMPSIPGVFTNKSEMIIENPSFATSWEKKTNKMKNNSGKDKKSRKEKASTKKRLYKQYNVKKGQQLVKVREKYYVVKKYNKMTEEQLTMERNDFELDFRSLNKAWAHKGHTFRPPGAEESLVSISVRYQQYMRFLKAQMCSDSYKIVLILSWVGMESLLCWFGFDASGYTENQIAVFDLYQERLIQMGETSDGFGQDWSPMTWLLFIAGTNMAITIAMNKLCDGDGAKDAMRIVSSIMTGNNVVVDERGVPLPPDQQPKGSNPIGSVASSILGEGNGLAGLATSLGPKALGFFSNFTSGMAAKGNAPKPRARRRPTHDK